MHRQKNRGLALSAALFDSSLIRYFDGQIEETFNASEVETMKRGDAKSADTGSLYASGSAPGAVTVDAHIVRLALPAMCGALIDPLQSLVDTAWVGRLGAAPLAALGPCCEVFTFSFR